MKQVLPTNNVDDILSDAMGGKRRFNLIPNEDGTYSLEDVSTYDQIGTPFGALNVNATNNAVNESADKNKVIDDLDIIKATTEAGYMAGALAVKELTNSLTSYDLYSINDFIGDVLDGDDSSLKILKKNGWCFITGSIIPVGNIETLTEIINGLPAPKIGNPVWTIAANTINYSRPLNIQITTDGTMKLRYGSNVRHYINIIYLYKE